MRDACRSRASVGQVRGRPPCVVQHAKLQVEGMWGRCVREGEGERERKRERERERGARGAGQDRAAQILLSERHCPEEVTTFIEIDIDVDTYI